MTTSCEEIHSRYKDRKQAAGTQAAEMRDVRDTYNSDIVVPLPELERNERPAIANLIAMGIDQISDRVASTVPDVVFPVSRPGFKNSEQAAKDKRQATLGWWDLNLMGLKLYRRARHLTGYGISPVLVRPDFRTGAPRWELKDPLGTFPAPTADPDDPYVPDVIFAVKRTLKWLQTYYPDQAQVLAKPANASPDLQLELLEYQDHDELVCCVTGTDANNDPRWSQVSDMGARVVELHRLPNRAGMCTAVVPGRINLDRRKGQFSSMVGMYQAQAKLFALEMIAVQGDIWPDEYLIGRQNEQPKVEQVADGPRGTIGVVTGGDFRQLHHQPGYMTMPLVDRIERAQRLTGGIPPDFGGESATNVRTGRRGENIMSATIDFGILQCHRVLQTSLELENKAAIAVDKGYHDGPKSFYVGWHGAKGQVEYKPTDLFDTDQNKVSYAQAGADAQGVVIGAAQRVGAGWLSKMGAAEMDPLIENPELEHDRIVAESLETALLASVQQGAAAGEIPPSDVARIVELVRTNRMELPEAIQKAQEEAQERQAAQVPPTDPAAQPGLAVPGMGAESMAAIPEPEASVQNLSALMSSLRRPQMTLASERPRPEAVV